MQINPHLLNGLFEKGRTVAESPGTASAESPSAVKTNPLTVKQALAKLHAMEKQLIRLVENRERAKNRFIRPKIKPMLDEVPPLNQTIEVAKDATDRQRYDAQLTTLSIYFLAAELSPSEFASQFRELASRKIGQTNDRAAYQAAVLKLYYDHIVKKSSGDALLNSLQSFSETHRDVRLGVAVYSLISRQLWRKRNIDLADDVLELGIKLYSGHPATRKLLIQRIDQRRG